MNLGGGYGSIWRQKGRNVVHTKLIHKIPHPPPTHTQKKTKNWIKPPWFWFKLSSEVARKKATLILLLLPLLGLLTPLCASVKYQSSEAFLGKQASFTTLFQCEHVTTCSCVLCSMFSLCSMGCCSLSVSTITPSTMLLHGECVMWVLIHSCLVSSLGLSCEVSKVNIILLLHAQERDFQKQSNHQRNLFQAL